MKEVTVLSLFDGISCLQVALERAGLKIKKYYASEIDKYAIQVTQHNYPDTIQLGDATKWYEWDIDWSSIDIVAGGSPCQSFSITGNRTGLDGKSGLFFDFADIVHNVVLNNPNAFFLLENVVMKKEWENIISNILGVQPIMINSALVSGQRRKRLYWTNIPDVTLPKDKGIMFKDVLEDLPYKEIPVYFHSYFGKNKRLEGVNRLHKEKSNTLTTNAGRHTQFVLNEDESLCRKLSPIEYERLQTLPCNYTIKVSNTQRYKAIGNGWTVDVIAHIFSFIK